MTRLGMDVEAVESVGRQLNQHGSRIRATMGAVDTLVGQAGGQWWGARGRRFVEEWRTLHRPALVRLAEAVEGLGRSALNNAAEQRTASATTGGHGVSGGGGRSTSGHATMGYGTTETRTTSVYADLARAGYGDEPPDGYQFATDQELRSLGIDPKSLHDRGSGFDAQVLIGRDGKYVVSFAGTNPKDHADLRADAEGALGTTTQSGQAIALATTIASHCGKDNVEFVGHSLGGREAALASIAVGSKAITFNAAGVSDTDIVRALSARPGTTAAERMVSHLPGAAQAERAQLIVTGQVTNHFAVTDPLTDTQAAAHVISIARMSPALVPLAVGRPVPHATTEVLLGAHNMEAISPEGPRRVEEVPVNPNLA